MLKKLNIFINQFHLFFEYIEHKYISVLFLVLVVLDVCLVIQYQTTVFQNTTFKTSLF